MKLVSLNKPDAPGIIRRVILSWLLAALIEYSLLPAQLQALAGLEGLANMSLARVIYFTMGFFILLNGLGLFLRTAKIERWGIVSAFAVLAILAVLSSLTLAFLVVCLLLLVLLAVFGIYGWDSTPEISAEPKKVRKAWLWATAGLSVGYFLFVSIWTVGRVCTFSTPTYDFGIFSQMFYYMKEFGQPLTTLERDGLLSHFAVHVSPIYYLILPFYCLVPTPATLQVAQAAILASAVIPLWLIGKHRGLSGMQRMLLCAVLLLYPAYSGGTSYDIHENCFLTPLLLWLFYGLERKNIPVTALAALLTLTVKEDAAVYVAVIGLWMVVKTLLRPKSLDIWNLITGSALLAGSVGYFFLITGWLASSGDGVMTYRYSNFIYDGSSSLFTVIQAVIMNPMKAVYECVDSEKLKFIALTLLPLLGLPLLTRRYERYILLIPYVLVNLMSDYQYQHDIFFQYTFGSTAFLIYLTAVNLSDLKLSWQRSSVLLAAAVVAAVSFGSEIFPKAIIYPQYVVQYRAYYENVRDALDTVPDDASVTSVTVYTTYLSQREVIYDTGYCSRKQLLESEYVVLSLSNKSQNVSIWTEDVDQANEELLRQLQENGYTQYVTLDGVLTIWRRQ